MKQSPYLIRKRELLKKKARSLYRKGYTTREVGKIVGRSHNWVWLNVRDLSTGLADKDLTRNDTKS